MEVKFGADQQPVEQQVASDLQPVSQLPATTAALPPPAKSGMLLGDEVPDFSQIVLPRINISQNIGELKDRFTSGSIVLGQSVSIFCPPDIEKSTGQVKRASTPPATLTVLGFRPTRFAEKVSGGVRGMIVNTEDEVRKAGGTLDYNEWKLKQASGIKRFEPMADALVLVERPATSADDGTVFVYTVAGKQYALALWAMRGTSYTAAAKRVFFTGRAIGCLRGGYPTYSFSVTTRLESYPGGNSAWVPICTPKDKSTPEFLAFVAEIIGGSTVPNAAPAAASENAATAAQ